jgi:hypothetical protein
MYFNNCLGSDEYTNISNSFQNGCSTIASKITSLGVSTASNASPSTMSTNISTLATNKYNAGVSAADNRAEPNSINYQTGYNNGRSSITGVTLVETLAQAPGSTWSTCGSITTSYHHIILVSGRYNGNYSTPYCSSGNSFNNTWASNAGSEGSGNFDGYYLNVPSGTTISLSVSNAYQRLYLFCFNLS